MGENYYYITPEHYKIAEKNGIRKNTLEERVRKGGWNVNKACTTPTRKKVSVPKDLMVIAEKRGISKLTIADRLRQGWTMEDACTRIKKSGYPRQYPDWVYDKAKKNNICTTTVNNRVKRGWDLEKACTEPVMSKHSAMKIAREVQKRRYNDRLVNKCLCENKSLSKKI